MRSREIERSVNEEWRSGDGYDHPNPPAASDYVRHAQELGFEVQTIARDGDGMSTLGAYYEVHAVYPAGSPRFGKEPCAMIFEDYSGPIWKAWLIQNDRDGYDPDA